MSKLSFNVGDTVQVSYEGIVTGIKTGRDEEIYNYVDVRDNSGRLHTYPVKVAENFIRVLPAYEIGDLWKTPNGRVYIIRKTWDFVNMHSITQDDTMSVDDFFRYYPKSELLYRLSNHGINLED